MDNGGPAFPTEAYDLDRKTTVREEGMTLRDYFAAKAMQGWLSSFSCESRHPTESGGAKYVAAASYAMADAMLAERNK
jgi:hypothetical protein